MDGNVVFRTEWLEAPGVRAPELAATWARFEIEVAGESVSLVEQVESRTTRRSVVVSVYPLAEWIAYNWWRLQYDSRESRPRRPGRATTGPGHRDQSAGQSIRFAAEGFPWPDLRVLPEGELTRLRCTPRLSPDGALRFLTAGEWLVQPDEVTGALRELVERTLTRLEEAGVHGTSLHAEWEATQRLDPEETVAAQALARLGLDPFDPPETAVSAVVETAELVPPHLLDDLLDVADVSSLRDAARWVRAAAEQAVGLPRPRVVDIEQLRQAVAEIAPMGVTRPPWVVGAAQAQQVRHALGVPSSGRFDIESYVSTADLPVAAPGPEALGSAAGGVGLVLSRRRSSEARRFAAARALWHGVTGSRARTFLVTDSCTARQKAERAFAAELLAPAEGLDQLLADSGPSTSDDDLVEVAAAYEVSQLVVYHQIENYLYRGPS